MGLERHRFHLRLGEFEKLPLGVCVALSEFANSIEQYSDPHSGGKLKSALARVKRELLDEPGYTVGRDTLFIGLVLGLVWLVLIYFRPGYPWSNGRFLVAAICFVFWGVADMLPHHLRSVAVVLRVAVSVFLAGLGIWVLADLVGWIAG